MDKYEIISIGIYFSLMLGIGFYSYMKSTKNIEGFLLGSRGMSSFVTALSAAAADMSGWLLMGLPGAMYSLGLMQAWMAIGLTLGSYLNYLLVAPRLRIYTEIAKNSITIPDYFENRFHDKSRVLRMISGVVILVFFTLYTSSGMVAGGTLFESAFGVPYVKGVIVISIIVLIYTVFGGFMAVSLTDCVQGAIMVTALVIVPIVAIYKIGGFGETFGMLNEIAPEKINIFSVEDALISFSIFGWGLGYLGQPHIIVRFMAIKSVKDLTAARRISLLWMIFSVGGALLIGLIAIPYVQKFGINLEDPETIFILFSKELFHPFITGLLLSAILAAVMSTISSQLLVTSSSLTEDFYKTFSKRKSSEKELLTISRIAVVVVALLAFALALKKDNSILNLVGNAWAGFGAAFGPVVLFSLFWKRMTLKGAIAGMVTGGIFVLLYSYIDLPYIDMSVFGRPPLNLNDFYSLFPAFLTASIVIVVVSLLTEKPSKAIEDEFDNMKKILKS